MSAFEKSFMRRYGSATVGSTLDDGSEIVANTGDRVIVNRDGQLFVYKDDNALLFREGAKVHTETFSDGSTRAILVGNDGSEVVTLRDGEGRVLSRSRTGSDGTEVTLFNDTLEGQPLDMARLSAYERVDSIVFSTADEAALRAAFNAETKPDRNYTIRQIRENEEVRHLVPGIDLDTLNFTTGSSAILDNQIKEMTSIGNMIQEILVLQPREVFLIEGYTDAVGDEMSNLGLSDRRAETIALALTENFKIAPENLLVQGYGEQFLKVETDDALLANRRATVRRITPLLQQAAIN